MTNIIIPCLLLRLLKRAHYSLLPIPYSLFPDWLIGAFCLLLPALYNGFPLVTSDSGGYIGNSYMLYLPIDRPVAYSVFIRLASLGGLSLWGVVVAQALIVSGLLLTIARHVLGDAYRRNVFAAIMLMMGLATSAGWTCGQLTPDIFTAVLLLSLCILSAVPIHAGAKWLLYALMLGCMLSHNSNLLIGLLLSVMLIVYAWRKHKAQLRQAGIALLGISAVAWISLSAMNAYAGHGFRPSAASHVFIMSRMVENGIADTYLNEYCATEPNTLCAFKGKLPTRQWNFMWDSTSPLYKVGGWEGTETEYSRIIRRSLTRPKYLMMHILKNSEATLRQLPLIQVGEELAPLKEGTSPYLALEAHSYNELKEYASAQQQEQNLGLNYWNMLIVLFTVGVIVTALFTSGRDGADHWLRGMLRMTLVFLVLNAAVTATLATVVARYEARVFWVLPFLATLHLVRRMRVKRLN